MRVRAKEGTCLESLVRMAIPLCREAEYQCPRAGPGRPPEFPDWVMTVLMMTAVLKKRKSKSAQYRFLYEHRVELQRWLSLKGFPSRTTYFDRYRRAHRLFEVAIRRQGRKGLREGVADARTSAVDKSLLQARGPLWHRGDRRANRIPKGLHGVDRDSDWGYSQHHGWVQGYSYEVVVSASKNSTVFPLLASVGTASAKEFCTFDPKIDHLPQQTRHVLADKGYDKNEFGDRIEYDDRGRRTGRRFLCPQNRRNTRKRAKRLPRPAPSASDRSGARDRATRRRRQRAAFLGGKRGRTIYARRSQTVEPFNEWFKSLFELDHRVWHRGLDNNRTQVLAAIFAYQLLLRYNKRRGRRNGQVQWILDQL